MKQTIKFQRVSLFRRICSIIFDGIIAVCLFVILFAFVSQPIISSTTSYDETYEKYNNELVSTHLYLYYEENQAVSLISGNYDKYLLEFYNDNDFNYDYEDYYELKYEKSNINPSLDSKEVPLFIYDEDNDTFLENVYVLDKDGNFTSEIDEEKKIKVNEFYKNLLNELNAKILNQEKILEYTQKLTALTMLMFFIAIIPTIIILYLLIPLLIKDGTTMGKKMLQMRVIDAKSGKDASKFQLLIRFVFFALINVVLGIFTYGLTIVFSIIMMFIFKTRQTLHDLVSGTMVVCNSFSESEKISQNEIIEITFDDGRKEEVNEEAVEE